MIPTLAFACSLLFPTALPLAQDSEAVAEPAQAAPQERAVTTSHSILLEAGTLSYTATAGIYVLAREDGTPKASLFYVAYVKEGGDDSSRRPLTFCFNGGPGSSSVWLHMGVFGPRRVLLLDDGSAPPPPYELVDNPHTLLEASDLVFIDPVTTGYSRPAKEEESSEFHGVEEDVEWVAEFIRLYVTRAGRWASPKYLAGESYGTTRAAALAGHLQTRHGMYLNGLMLISSILDFQTARFDVGNDLPYPLFLPTYTATAFYHGKLDEELSRDLSATLAEVEHFALGEYASALMLGDRLPQEELSALAVKLARYTGLSPEYVERSNLRIQIGRFCKELLRDRRRTVGRLDSRFTGIDLDAAGERYEYDPSYAAILGPFSATLHHYVREELGFESDLPYEILTGRVRPWSYANWQNRYLNVAETLRSAMTRNPALRVFVASGYYDLATPYLATQYTFDHLGLDPSLRGNVHIAHYESGHMMYIHQPSLLALERDLEAFLDLR